MAGSSAGDTLEGYESFGCNKLVMDSHSQRVSLLDVNREAKYEALSLSDFDVHLVLLWLAARVLDPEAFVICSAVTKSHNAVVGTLSGKNMVAGAPPLLRAGRRPSGVTSRDTTRASAFARCHCCAVAPFRNHPSADLAF